MTAVAEELLFQLAPQQMLSRREPLTAASLIASGEPADQQCLDIPEQVNGEQVMPQVPAQKSNCR